MSTEPRPPAQPASWLVQMWSHGLGRPRGRWGQSKVPAATYGWRKVELRLWATGLSFQSFGERTSLGTWNRKSLSNQFPRVWPDPVVDTRSLSQAEPGLTSSWTGGDLGLPGPLTL